MQLVFFSLTALVCSAAAFPSIGAGRPKVALTIEPAVRTRQVSLDLVLAALNFQEPQLGEG